MKRLSQSGSSNFCPELRKNALLISQSHFSNFALHVIISFIFLNETYLHCQLVILSSFVEMLKRTIKIDTHKVDIEEKGIKLKLTVVDTPGYGDAIDNSQW